MSRKPKNEALISVVVPVYNEAEVLEELEQRITAELERLGVDHELWLIDDGSDDATPAILARLATEDRRLKVVHLTRNFGPQAAVQAGLRQARGDAIVVMDADLQDDPGALPRFIEHWQQGYDIVYAVRKGRKEGVLKRILFKLFYRLLHRLTTPPLPLDAGNFSLLDGRYARRVAELEDYDRYFPGLRRWIGGRQVGIPVERGPRYDGQPRVSLGGLLRLAKSALFSFSSFPLTIFYLVFGLAALVFIGLSTFTLYHRLVTGLAIPGWTSTILTASFFGALNALGIAVLGEYVVRIYDQVRRRPRYLIKTMRNVGEAEGEAEVMEESAGMEV